MLLISAVGGEQLRSTAQSDTAASPSREFFGTRQHDIRARRTYLGHFSNRHASHGDRFHLKQALCQVLQLLKIGCKSHDDDTLCSHWSDSVMMTRTMCVACLFLDKFLYIINHDISDI